MNENKMKGILEALLMSSPDPLSLEQLQAIFTELPEVSNGEEFYLSRPAYLSEPSSHPPGEETSLSSLKPTRNQLQKALEELSKDYDSRAIELKRLPDGYVLQTKKYYSPWVSRLQANKPAKYSRALLETLAIIAYRQPVTRADIEEIRGVAVASSIFKTLLERDWIRMAGQRDIPGKPALYATTKTFLSYFNLISLEELPSLTLC